MNALTEWLKKNWLIAALTLFILVSLPTMIYFGLRMERSIKEEVQQRVSEDMKELASPQVSFAIRTIDGQEAMTHRAIPNRELIELFSAKQAEVQQSAGAAITAAVEFNRGDKALLVEGLFPEPAFEQRRIKPLEFATAYIGPAHQELLRIANAGSPPDPAEVAALLRDFSEQQRQRIAADTGAEPPEEVMDRVREQLTQIRIGQYRQRAAEISVYADRSVFAGVPQTVPTQDLPLGALWDWQERYWLHRDIMRAIAAANADSSGGVPASVVKRVLSVAADDPAFMAPAQDRRQQDPYGGGYDDPMAGGAPRAEGLIPVDYARSVTGRHSDRGSGNTFFDMRTATVEIIASSQRLPQFFDALARQNFFTVIDLDLERVEPLEDLQNGYFYGTEHVVRARVRLEWVLLREWTVPMMPPDVKRVLQIQEPETDGGGPG